MCTVFIKLHIEISDILDSYQGWQIIVKINLIPFYEAEIRPNNNKQISFYVWNNAVASM